MRSAEPLAKVAASVIQVEQSTQSRGRVAESVGDYEGEEGGDEENQSGWVEKLHFRPEKGGLGQVSDALSSLEVELCFTEEIGC